MLGVVSTPTKRYPEGMRRVVLLGDPTQALGALAEPECRRVLAAIELARRLHAPVEWFAISAGAKIAMDSGTETMDWISRVLRGIIEFTQDGGEINVVVTGINVGAQPYWNAEATMLMHTRGVLIMTPDSAMVLTGKQSLDYSGGVSAEDNFGIGGYDRIMGPNGEAQYWAPDLSSAVDVLLAHYEHTYVAPGERFPRPAPTTDPADRDISASPHAGPEFSTLGEIFDPASNPERKKPFDMRSLLGGVVDADHPPLERWADMADAASVVVLDAHLGGQPVALIGFESRPLTRHGFYPVDGPSQWTAGTLFPRSSKKTARAINAASGNRPLVILANLSGFDGSPESLRQLQLEYGAEIGRAVVNFDGPIVFCVVSRYHGGAFVVQPTPYPNHERHHHLLPLRPRRPRLRTTHRANRNHTSRLKRPLTTTTNSAPPAPSPITPAPPSSPSPTTPTARSPPGPARQPSTSSTPATTTTTKPVTTTYSTATTTQRQDSSQA